MKNITVYEVRQHDGMGGDMHVCFTENVAVATEVVERYKSLEYPHIREKEMVIATSYHDFLNWKNKGLVDSALSKLTPAERKSLGF